MGSLDQNPLSEESSPFQQFKHNFQERLNEYATNHLFLFFCLTAPAGSPWFSSVLLWPHLLQALPTWHLSLATVVSHHLLLWLYPAHFWHCSWTGWYPVHRNIIWITAGTIQPFSSSQWDYLQMGSSWVMQGKNWREEKWTISWAMGEFWTPSYLAASNHQPRNSTFPEIHSLKKQSLQIKSLL